MLAGVAGIIYASNIKAADAQRRRPVHRALRHPRRRARRHLAHGRQVRLAGTVVGVLIIQTLNSTILFLGVPPAQSPVFKAVVVMVVCLVQSPRFTDFAPVVDAARRRRCRRRCADQPTEVAPR